VLVNSSLLRSTLKTQSVRRRERVTFGPCCLWPSGKWSARCDFTICWWTRYCVTHETGLVTAGMFVTRRRHFIHRRNEIWGTGQHNAEIYDKFLTVILSLWQLKHTVCGLYDNVTVRIVNPSKPNVTYTGWFWNRQQYFRDLFYDWKQGKTSHKHGS
jgi:hypothetical protein